MRIDDFDYELSPDRIAQRPAEERETARLMLLPPGELPPEDHTIAELANLVPPGSLVVVNDTRVVPARILGTKRGSGGRAEIFLLRKVELPGSAAGTPQPGGEGTQTWSAMGRASKGIKPGTVIDAGPLEIGVLERASADGMLVVGLKTRDGRPVRDAILEVGRVPLPPYIRRGPDDGAELGDMDRDRYQTMFARVEGAVAAPTAGLHLTHALVDRLRARGCTLASVTLHVGLGTFQPVSVADLDDHPMHSEWFEVSHGTARAVAEARARGAAVVAIGTTVVRALESAAAGASGELLPGAGETRLLIQPGYRFQAVDLLLTNFHLPRSTLLALVCAFGGTARVLSAYRAAHEARYRFFSYGDAMLIHRAPYSLLSGAR